MRRRWLAGLLALTAVVVAALTWRSASAVDASLVAVVTRGTMNARLMTSGTLRPIESLTYRSPVPGRELEIVQLVAEGSLVEEGDLLATLDSTDLDRDIDRLRQELRQLQLDLQLAHAERQEAEAALKTAVEGEGALTVEEARLRLQGAQKKVERLRQEFEQTKPLLDKGYITREELARTSNELEVAEEELSLARKRHDVTVQLTHPREKQRAALQLAQRQSQLENVVGRVQETELRLRQVLAMKDACTIRARRPGLVVYEQFLSASPRRKIRVGDRVSASQGLITIPEVKRMVVEASVTEAEVHRVKPGQKADVRLEAFPAVRLTGKVMRVGTLATSSVDRPLDDRRFDLIIELDPAAVDLRPEMTAMAEIVVDVRQNTLMIPVTAVFEQDGAFVAHVATTLGAETRTLQLGETNGEFVEVLSGLTEHDRVLLLPPSSSAVPAVPPASNGTVAPSTPSHGPRR